MSLKSLYLPIAAGLFALYACDPQPADGTRDRMDADTIDQSAIDTAPGDKPTEGLAFTDDKGRRQGPAFEYYNYPRQGIYTLMWHEDDAQKGKRYLFSTEGRLLATIDSITALPEPMPAQDSASNRGWMRLHLPSGYLFAEGPMVWNLGLDEAPYYLIGDWKYYPLREPGKMIPQNFAQPQRVGPLNGGSGWEELSGHFLTI